MAGGDQRRPARHLQQRPRCRQHHHHPRGKYDAGVHLGPLERQTRQQRGGQRRQCRGAHGRHQHRHRHHHLGTLSMRPPQIVNQRGFSMVELMVALLIGVVLTSGVISVFITSRNTYNLNNAVGQVQEEGRFALTTLQPLIAEAGFTGCAHVPGDKLNNYKSLVGTGDSDPVYMVQYGIYGYEYKGTGIGASYTDTTGQTPAVATSASEWTYPLSTELFNAISTASAPVV